MIKFNISTKKYPNTYTLIDQEDLENVNQYKWSIHTRGYVVSTQYIKGSGRKNTKNKHICLHRLINKTPNGFFTDHINHNKLDNRRSNLRTVTCQQNNFNRAKQRNNTSGYKGVYLQRNKWLAMIYNNGKYIYLGLFKHKMEAGLAYNKAAKEYFGEFAYLNKIGGQIG